MLARWMPTHAGQQSAGRMGRTRHTVVAAPPQASLAPPRDRSDGDRGAALAAVVRSVEAHTVTTVFAFTGGPAAVCRAGERLSDSDRGDRSLGRRERDRRNPRRRRAGDRVLRGQTRRDAPRPRRRRRRRSGRADTGRRRLERGRRRRQSLRRNATDVPERPARAAAAPPTFAAEGTVSITASSSPAEDPAVPAAGSAGRSAQAAGTAATWPGRTASLPSARQTPQQGARAGARPWAAPQAQTAPTSRSPQRPALSESGATAPRAGSAAAAAEAEAFTAAVAADRPRARLGGGQGGGGSGYGPPGDDLPYWRLRAAMGRTGNRQLRPGSDSCDTPAKLAAEVKRHPREAHGIALTATAREKTTQEDEEEK